MHAYIHMCTHTRAHAPTNTCTHTHTHTHTHNVLTNVSTLIILCSLFTIDNADSAIVNERLLQDCKLLMLYISTTLVAPRNTNWQCRKYLEEEVDSGRWHGEIVHLAKALSARDLFDQVAKQCPEGTPKQWLRLRFWPKNPNLWSKLANFEITTKKLISALRYLTIKFGDHSQLV